MDKSLKDRCKGWGRWRRTGQPTGYARRGVLGRLKEEGHGAGEQGGLRDFVPIKDCPEMYSDIELTWIRKMEELERTVFSEQFEFYGSPYKKAARVSKKIGYKIGKSKLYEVLENCEDLLLGNPRRHKFQSDRQARGIYFT